MGGDERDERPVDRRSVDEKLAPHDFVADFVWAGREVLRKPSMAVVSVVLWGLPAALGAVSRVHRNPLLTLVGFALAVFALGWLGAERTFFRLRREGKEAPLSELLGAAPSFIGRFFRLSLLTGIVVFPVMVVGLVAMTRYVKAGDFNTGVAVLEIATLGVMLPVDLALTFVTPALAFTTASATEALGIGFRMIRQTWPRSGLYILCPPLALNMLNAMYPTRSLAFTLVTTPALAVLALAAKGATAAFYLRNRPAAAPDVDAALAPSARAE
jgi:hypothetical protein